MTGFQYSRDKCKVEDCPEPPAARQGPYAGFCEGHAEDAKERRRNNMAAKRKSQRDVSEEVHRDITHEIKVIKGSKKQLTQSAIRLAASAEIFEIAAEKRDDHIDEARQALAKLNESLEEFKRIVKAKLTGGPAPSE
jgi:hypothetical protein